MSQQPSAENPQACLQPVFDLLNKVATERKEGCCRVCEVLAIDPTISIFLQERENKPINNTFGTLLKDVSNIVQECAVKRTIADWPFENFWGNPNEPKHSKLLAHFINPAEKHGYGKDLLKELLKVCGKECLLVDDHCEVTSEKSRIDILLKRKEQGVETNSNNNYAVIFENKINGARNTEGDADSEGQLDKYVNILIKDGFDKHIHVFYLPLREDKEPNPVDKNAIIGKVGANNYKRITFVNEILSWLNNVTDGKTVALKEGMRDNLNHYKNLITYLINKNKESKMKNIIFEQLKSIDERGNALPSLESALRAQEALNELVPCLQIHETLKAVEAEIQQKKPKTEIKKNFPYDEGRAVGLKVSDSEAIVWFGRDIEDNQWFFAYQHGSDNVLPEPFKIDQWWWGGDNGERLVKYRLVDVVLGKGTNFSTLDLPSMTIQKIAEKLLEWQACRLA